MTATVPPADPSAADPRPTPAGPRVPPRAGGAPGRSATRRRVLLRGAALAGVGGLAVAAVRAPYTGDQALYALIGRDVAAGRALYTGIWDIKQPGIFLWYRLVESLAGAAELATRTADVLAVLLTAVLLGWALRGRVPGAVAFWVPVLVAAGLLGTSRPLELGQVEQLALVPMTAAAALVLPRGGRRPGPLALLGAGLAVGVVAVLKVWLAAVPLAVVAAVLLARGVRDRRTAARLALVGAGALVPVLAVLAWLAAAGALAEAYRTWFVESVAVLDVAGSRTPQRLVSGAGRFAVLWLVLLVPAALAVPRALRRRDPLDLAGLAWAGTGVVVLLGQLWWAYHWIVLVPGLAWLAARTLARSPARWAWLVALGAVPALVLALADRSGDGGVAHRDAVRAGTAAAGLRPADTLYVLGDPLYHLDSGRPVALRLNGWSPELFTPGQWAEVGADLAGPGRPDVVFLESAYAAVTAAHGPPVTAALDAHYAVTGRDAAGTWFRARAAGTPAAPAPPTEGRS